MEKLTLNPKELKQKLLELLEAFDQICSANNLTYTLYGGTLLGAIRHGGFIPWDDDLDVAMPRDDYEKLLKLEPSMEWPYGIVTANHSDLITPFAKVVNREVRMQEPVYGDDVKEFLWLDIFPLDGVDRDLKKANITVNKINKHLRALRHAYLAHPEDGKAKSMIRKIVKLATVLSGGKKRHLDVIQTLLDQCPKILESKYITGYLDELDQPVLLPRNEVLNTIAIMFEGREYSVMKCWELYLTGTYGDWRALPPIEDRQNHGVVAWIEN